MADACKGVFGRQWLQPAKATELREARGVARARRVLLQGAAWHGAQALNILARLMLMLSAHPHSACVVDCTPDLRKPLPRMHDGEAQRRTPHRRSAVSYATPGGNVVQPDLSEGLRTTGCEDTACAPDARHERSEPHRLPPFVARCRPVRAGEVGNDRGREEKHIATPRTRTCGRADVRSCSAITTHAQSQRAVLGRAMSVQKEALQFSVSACTLDRLSEQNASAARLTANDKVKSGNPVSLVTRRCCCALRPRHVQRSGMCGARLARAL